MIRYLEELIGLEPMQRTIEATWNPKTIASPLHVPFRNVFLRNLAGTNFVAIDVAAFASTDKCDHSSGFTNSPNSVHCA